MKDKLIAASLICITILISGCTSLPSVNIPFLWGASSPTPSPSQPFDAILINETIPDSMVPGHSYTVSVTMRNTGYSSWSSADPVVLAPTNDPVNDAKLLNNTVLTISPGVIVKTGSDYTWHIILHAPGWNGNCTVQYQMKAGNDTFFGNDVSQNIVVGNQGSAVVYVPQDVYYYPHLTDLHMNANSLQNVSVTVQNMGRNGWSEDNQVRLAVVDYEPNNAYLFNGAVLFHIAPEAIVNPGEQCTWRFQLHAPPSPGKYKLEYQMKQGDEWLGNPLIVYITVT